MFPRTTLEQWRVLQAIVDAGGFAQAAQELHRSQSSVSYAVARLQEQVGVPLLAQEGRRMQLTPAGAVLLRDAKHLLDSMTELERKAKVLENGWEPVVRLAVDGLYPTGLLLQVLVRIHCSNMICPFTICLLLPISFPSVKSFLVPVPS